MKKLVMPITAYGLNQVELLSEYNKLQSLVEDMFRLFNLIALQKIETSNEIASELEKIRKKYPEFNLEPHQ